MKRGPFCLSIVMVLGATYWESVWVATAPPIQNLTTGALFTSRPMSFEYGMVLTALISVGVILTFRRLRDIGWSDVLLPLYMIPWISLPFVLLLTLFPSEGDQPLENHVADAVVPIGQPESAVLAIVVPAVIGAGVAALGIGHGWPYGLAMFLALPFCMGMISSFIYGYYEVRRIWETLCIAMLSVILLGLVLLAIAVEGVICLFMAAPIAFAMACFGVVLVHVIRGDDDRPSRSATMTIFLCFFMPMTMGAESAAHIAPPEWIVHTTIEINAPPDRVWKNVVAFPPAPAPRELPFRVGIAYPIEAKLHGQGGVGSMRSCEFSTGSFVEVIDVWEPGRRMEFSVAAGADPMTEMTPYPSIHPPHLDGYLHPRHAVFTLTPLPGGRTRLEGTSYYRNAIWPAQYWRLWSDYIIHSVHHRVFEHVKRLSEMPS